MKNQPPSPTPTSVTVAQAIESYLHYQEANVEKSTLRNYRSACRRLLEYLKDDALPYPSLSFEAPLATLTADRLIGIPHWLYARGLSPNSRATYLSALHNLVSYWFRESLLLLNAQQYERLKAAFKDGRKGARRKLPHIPGNDAIDQMLAFIYQQTVDGDEQSKRYRRRKLRRLRDIAIFELLRDLGLRPQELVALQRKSLDKERRQLVIEITKSKEGRRLAVADRAWEAIAAYLEARQDKGALRTLGALPLFAKHSRKAGNQVTAISTRMVRLLAQKYVRDANVEVALTPYSLRHQAGTDFWEHTGNVILVRDFLGHQDVGTTQIYVKVGNTAVNAALKEARKGSRPATPPTSDD